MLGLEYALLVTQVQWTANSIRIIISATTTILFTFIPTPSSAGLSSFVFLTLPTWQPQRRESHRHLKTLLTITSRLSTRKKKLDLYSVPLWEARLWSAQVWITQFLLANTPYLAPPRKHSPEGATTDFSNKSHLIAAYYSFIDPERMKGWVGWPTVGS